MGGGHNRPPDVLKFARASAVKRGFSGDRGAQNIFKSVTFTTQKCRFLRGFWTIPPALLQTGESR